MINFLRPVASIAARNSGCDQAWVEVRSIGVTSGKYLGNLLEQRVDEDAALRSDRREDGRDAEVLGCLGEAGDIVDHQAWIDRVNH